ncbi:unnamed protein product [Acanthoscelides obtectus]|uniref:Uncharacterized protein n=3 Tax=Acanthoscelides obtectus TaxID=200917 RepID=A0A9P0M2I2_ACAOB|nr:unnamed protein product [Acanthoscelides obtectus]CAK1657809.1 Protein-cysteine N-palmitoyltransferase Rasp [Acanthoscelides obtectus]
MNDKVTKISQILFTSFYLTISGGSVLFTLLLLQPVIFYVTHCINANTIFKWICSLISLGLIILYKKDYTATVQEAAGVNDYQIYLFTLSLSWMNLKCTSFYLEEKTGNILDFFSYCLYFPTIFMGPFILHEDFKVKYSHYTPTKMRVWCFIKNVLITLFWFLFEGVMLHFVYVNAAAFHPFEFLQNLDSWAFYGFGYAMGQHFHIKYVVIYGLSTSLASFENVMVPHLPRCIGRIHLYSDMWKYFDAGLYKFLVKHIYIPIVKLTSLKLLASMATFGFVYIWHGTATYILIWCILNYIGIVLEQTCSPLLSVKKSEGIKFFLDWPRRMRCFFGAVLLAVSAISNFYFFGGKNIGDLFFRRLFADNLPNTIILLFILYCGAQVSTELCPVHARKCDNNPIKMKY